MKGTPDWCNTGYAKLEVFPAVRWKRQHIDVLRRDNPKKHAEQVELLDNVLDGAFAEAAE